MEEHPDVIPPGTEHPDKEMYVRCVLEIMEELWMFPGLDKEKEWMFPGLDEAE